MINKVDNRLTSVIINCQGVPSIPEKKMPEKKEILSFQLDSASENDE